MSPRPASIRCSRGARFRGLEARWPAAIAGKHSWRAHEVFMHEVLVSLRTHQERRMPRPGFVVFILFFGIALLDALRGGHWPRVAFWLVIAALFWLLDRRHVPARPGRYDP